MKTATNMMALTQQYGTDDECRETIQHLRWPGGVTCLRCHSENVSPETISDRKVFVCYSCRYQFSATVGTMFHDSHLPLTTWFFVTYIMTESRKGVSANQIKRMFGVSYKTAWYLCHRIRKAMEEVGAPKLKGVVEVDETYVGGRRRGVGSGNLDHKTMVLGAVERGGAIRLRVERKKRASKEVLHAFIADVTEPNTKRLITDCAPGYHGIADADTTHETVDHAINEWVRGDVHTNTVENAWSLFKRSIVGAYHQVSAKHLDSYLNEFEWRFNNRKNAFLFRDTLLKLIHSSNLEYKELTKAA